MLAGIALSALGSSFTGTTYLVVGMLGVVLAVVVTHLTRAAGWPIISAVTILVVLFFLLGGPLCLRSVGDTSVLPGASTLARVADQAVFGWKDLLTTLPPVDGDGPLLVLPWLAGLLAGLVGLGLAHLPVRRAWVAAVLPVLGMTLVLSGAILIGVRHPQSLLLQGSVFAGLALAWLAIRARRASAAVQGGSTSYVRGVGAVAMLALAAGIAFPASALVAGDDDERAVARNWVAPPFDIGRYPSPLAGFRKYIDLKGETDRANVYDKTLLEIQGVPAETRVRFAAMDRYDGMVWGASDNALPGPADDSFQRVSSTIDNPVADPAEGALGRETDVTVTLGEGWSGVWLPTVGALQSMSFETADARSKAEVFRYNLATSTAVVPTGLQAGDRYSFTAIQPDDVLTPETVGSSEVTSLPAGAAFIQGPTEKWTEGAGSDPMARVLAAAEHLRSEGKYSDGVGRTERIYVAGHSVWRLSDEFVNAPADRRQRRAVRRHDGADRQRHRRARPGRPRRRRARGRRGHGPRRVGVGRAPRRRRLLAHPADRGVHGHHAAVRPGARDQHPDVRDGDPAAQPDPAAVRRGGAERRRPQGAQGHPQEGRRGRGRTDRRPARRGSGSW